MRGDATSRWRIDRGRLKAKGGTVRVSGQTSRPVSPNARCVSASVLK